MKPITEVDFDPVESVDRAEAWETVRIGMKLGHITPENITPEQITAVRDYFGQLPVIDVVDARRGQSRVIGVVNLVEGREWAFATTRDGTFGVFSLDPPSRLFLHSAVLHLWEPAHASDPHVLHRQDFTDVGDYQAIALNAMLAA